MRLSLSVSTTRLILLHHDAGDIIYSFGNFVVGGNIVVGLVIFTIITIVQFMVITKGAERVAEVSARFSLDGMPGKQMSIDGDMRAGVIDPLEAKSSSLPSAKGKPVLWFNGRGDEVCKRGRYCWYHYCFS